MVTTSSKLDALHVRNVDYKDIAGQSISASVLWPKDIQSGTHPIIVRWHGGGFATGHRLFEDWIPLWLLDLTLRHDAILIMPDYQFLPESSGVDILEDVHSLFFWLRQQSTLTSCLPSHVVADVEDILVTGESAGGWLAWQSAFYEPQMVRAVVAAYPMLDLRDGQYTGDYEKEIFNPPTPQIDSSILHDHVAGLAGDEVVTSAIPPAREELFISMLQQGSFGRFFGDDAALYPLEMLDMVDSRKDKMPPMWIFHGEKDTVIPVAGTHKYEEKLRETQPDAKLLVTAREGLDHGFDLNPPARLDGEWMREGIDFVEQYWPKERHAGE